MYVAGSSAWPTGFCGVYEVDGGNTNPDVAADFCTTAVAVASKVAHSGPNAAAKTEHLASSEARARPPPLQSSQDAAPVLSHMGFTEKSGRLVVLLLVTLGTVGVWVVGRSGRKTGALKACHKLALGVLVVHQHSVKSVAAAFKKFDKVI